MACLDWSEAEDERVAAQVARDMGNARRGVKEIWQRVEEDSRDQEALHLVADSADICIFAKP